MIASWPNTATSRSVTIDAMTTSYPQPVLAAPLERTVVAARDAWSSTTTLPFEHFISPVVDEDDEAPIERPKRIMAFRIVTAALGIVAVIVATQLLDGSRGDQQSTGEALRLGSLIVATGYLLSHAVFAAWTLRHRLIIDQLRWRSFRRDTWSPSWAVGWVVTPIVAGAIYIIIAVSNFSSDEARALAFFTFALSLAAVRVMMLKTLGTNMNRVVLRARKWLGTWGVAVAVVDVLVFGVVVNAFINADPRRDMLSFSAGWASLALVVAGMFQMTYMKRVERWILEWWDHRYGVTEQDVLNVLSVVRPISGPPEAFDARRLAPTYLLRWIVVVAYWMVAAAALAGGWTVWNLRDELTLSSDPDAAVDTLAASTGMFIGALVIMQIAQGLWSIGQAWNARRCTLDAPSPFGMAVLFLAGPAVLVVGLSFSERWTTAIVTLALLVNLAGWATSFSVLSRTTQTLGRSAQHIAMWSAVVTMHWVLGFLARPLVLIESDSALVASIVFVSIIDGAIFVAASVYAWRSMWALDEASRDFEQIRRV